MLVHGDNGLDEISISGETLVVEVREGRCSAPFVITPEMFDLPRHPFSTVVGGNPARNADITRYVLTGTPGAPLDIVLLNAGAALYIARKTDSIKEGVELARESVASGRAWDKMAAFVEFTRTWQPDNAAGGAQADVVPRAPGAG
jgi:anthranilate phosphoribosyltransferase